MENNIYLIIVAHKVLFRNNDAATLLILKLNKHLRFKEEVN